MKCFLGRLTFGAIALLLMAGPVNADISASERRLDAVMAEYWEFTLREEPIAATSVGVNDFNDRMPHVTRADQLRRLAVEKSFLRRAPATARPAPRSSARAAPVPSARRW